MHAALGDDLTVKMSQFLQIPHVLQQHGAARTGGHTPAYVREFADWMWERLEARDVDALLDYRRSMPSAARAHPTEEHLLPLYVALGAGGDEFTAERIHAGIDDYVLAMDAFSFASRQGASA